MDDELPPENEARKRPDVEREYRSRQGEIVAYWEPKICNHTGNCFRGLPEVFQPQHRPWVLVDAASADKIAAVVMTCPTGALHFERFEAARKNRNQKKQRLTQGLMVRCTFEVECGLSDRAAN